MTRATRLSVAWIALVAIVFAAGAQAANAWVIRGAVDIWGQICISGGFKRLAEDGGSERKSQRSDRHCPFCRLDDAPPALVVPRAAGFAPSAWISSISWHVVESPRSPFLLDHVVRPRGPPFIL